MRKTQILMNKPVYLGLSILDLSETVIYEFWYDYEKPKFGENRKLYYMVSLLMKKEMIFTKMLQKILKKDLAIQILK